MSRELWAKMPKTEKHQQYIVYFFGVADTS